MATLTLNNVTFTGNGPFNGQVLEFRHGDEPIGTATIPQADQTVTFSGASGSISGIDFIKVYYQTGGPCRGTFVSAVKASSSGPGACECTAGVYGGGHLILSYTVS
ncbi:hypothetical protein Lepto7375DRAFT_4329 [Leptolyngbya sp. PCC 7375]|nr:hypothetical protein Lepto7375DRAFT_4329 [Leptolyngbya sp. PCC 7375]